MIEQWTPQSAISEIKLSAERTKWRPMLRQMRKNTLRQTMQMRVVNYTPKIQFSDCRHVNWTSVLLESKHTVMRLLNQLIFSINENLSIRFNIAHDKYKNNNGQFTGSYFNKFTWNDLQCIVTISGEFSYLTYKAPSPSVTSAHKTYIRRRAR